MATFARLSAQLLVFDPLASDLGTQVSPSQPPQRKVYEAAHGRGVRREEQLHWGERSLAQERARVREGAETIHSMRTARSAVVEPAKRQIGMHKVQHGIIDAGSTGRGACCDLCNVSAAAAEDV